MVVVAENVDDADEIVDVDKVVDPAVLVGTYQQHDKTQQVAGGG